MDKSKPKNQNTQVLIVDDEYVNRRVLKGLLRENGVSAAEAECGEQTLSCLESNDFDLILLDINMSGMDGFEVLQRVRALYERTEVSIVMVTADSDTSHIVRALQSGANDYITKPIDPDEVIARIVTQLQMIEAQKALRMSEERYALAAKATNDGLWDWDILADDVYYSTRWRSMLGVDENDPIDSPSAWFDRIHTTDRQRVRSEIDQHLRGDTPHFETELRMLHSDGNYRWMHCRGLAFHNQNGEPRRLAGSLSDVTARKVVDALTSLPNRMLFLDRLQRCLESARRNENHDFAVLFIDLDNFKLVNDSLGHDVGDRLLITIADRLEASVRGYESVIGRLGGDEFAVLLERIEHADDADFVAKRILARISEPCLIEGQEIFPCGSIGISFGTSTACTAEEVIREADTAMYQAKAQGKARISHFHPSMHHEVTQRLQLQNQLRRAVLSDEQLLLHYQPVVQLGTGRIIGFEALIRWQHPSLELVPPDKFIPIAEETGLVVPIGRWAIEQSCRQLSQWNEEFPDFQPFISVNVSSRQLVEPQLVETVDDVLKATGIMAAHLKLEVTESAIMDNPDDSSFVLSCLRDLGVKTGIDDFGTGYSSLACLHRLPLDLLKVDRSFVAKMLNSSENEAIVRTIIRLAESLGLDVIAEGIETEEQARWLREMGCCLGQGFYYSKPLKAAEVVSLMTESPAAEPTCSLEKVLTLPSHNTTDDPVAT